MGESSGLICRFETLVNCYKLLVLRRDDSRLGGDQMQRTDSCQFIEACEAMAAARYGDALHSLCKCIAIKPNRLDYHAMLWEVAMRCRAGGGPLPVLYADCPGDAGEIISRELAWLQQADDSRLAREFVSALSCYEKAHRSANLASVRSWVTYRVIVARRQRSAA